MLTKLQIAVRRNERNRLMKNFSYELEKIISSPVSSQQFIDIEEGERLFSVLTENIIKKRNLKKIFLFDNKEDIHDYLVKKFNKTKDKKGYIFFGIHEILGAWKVKADVFFENITRLLEFDGDTVSFLFENEKEFIYLTFYPADDDPRNWTYETVINLEEE